MKDRLTTLLLASAALLLAMFLLIPPSSKEQTLSLPTSEDRGANGLKGLYQWLQANSVPVYSLRKRFSVLATLAELDAAGNLLIISMPQTRQALKSEWRDLSNWLNQGNSLIILGAAYSTPNWAKAGDCFCDIKKLLTRHGWQLKQAKHPVEDPERDGREDEPEPETTLSGVFEKIEQGVQFFDTAEATFKPIPNIPILAKVAEVRANITPALINLPWLLSATTDGVAIRLLAATDHPDITTFWQISNHSGAIYLSLLPDIFANGLLDKADNAGLIANIINQNLAPGGRVIFDDYHFGLSELYDPDHFFSDTRLHQTMAWIALLWFLYVLGYSNRLAPVRPVTKPISTTDWVTAMAGFFTHRIDKRTLAQELVKHLIQDIRRQRQLADDDQTWHWLQQQSQVQSAQLQLLQRAQQRQSVALDKLTNTITYLRTSLLIS